MMRKNLKGQLVQISNIFNLRGTLIPITTYLYFEFSNLSPGYIFSSQSSLWHSDICSPLFIIANEPLILINAKQWPPSRRGCGDSCPPTYMRALLSFCPLTVSAKKTVTLRTHLHGMIYDGALQKCGRGKHLCLICVISIQNLASLEMSVCSG